jgi:AbrB family looped-hinge helix DNA binding protein
MQEIAKVDEKGRLLIPSGVRKVLGLESGVEVLVGVEGRTAIISPVFDKRVYELRIIMGDTPGTLAKIAAVLSKEGFDIIMSESRSLERERSAEWDVTGKYKGDLSSLVAKLRRLDFVSGITIKK